MTRSNGLAVRAMTARRIDWSAISGDVALALLGEPNARLSTVREWRYGRRGSLAVHVAGDRAGTWRDFESGEGGGVLDLIAHVRGCDRAGAIGCLREAGIVENTGEDGGISRPEPRSRPDPCNANASRTAAGGRKDTRAAARRVWNTTRPLAGTGGEAYLDARGVGHVAGAPALRFAAALSHPTGRGRYPCLVAGVQDVTGRFVGIHRCYLTSDGSGKAAVAPVRASLGRLAGGAVRLSEPHDGRLLVGEGLETTAAAVLVLDWQGGAWAALGTSGLKAVKLPEHVREVAIAADRDAGGLRAAAVLARRLEGEGRTVEIRAPCRGDFADSLSEAG